MKTKLDATATGVVLLAAVILGLVMGLRMTLGLFLPHMTIDVGIGAEAFGLAMAVSSLLWGAAQPVAGTLADRRGPLAVLVAGALLYAAGLAGMAVVQNGWHLLVAGGVLIGLGMGAAGFAVLFSAATRAVAPAQRQHALSLVSIGGGFGAFVLPPLVMVGIEAWGWQATLYVMAATLSLVILAAIALARLGRRGAVPASAAVAPVPPRPPLLVLREALRHRGFVLLSFGFLVCGFHINFLMTHLPGFVASCGLAPEVGALALAVTGLANVVGTWGAGALAGRYRQKHLLALLYLARAGLIALLVVLPKTPEVIIGFSALFGLLFLSTVPLTSGLIGRIFGSADMGLLFGFAFLSHQVGGFFGAWLGGRVYDATGAYDAMWTASIALGLLAAVLHWPIRDAAVTAPAVARAA